MKNLLNDINWTEFSYEFVVYLKTLGLHKQIIFESFDDYLLTVPKSSLEREYLNELNNARGADQNAIDAEKEKIKKDWKKERRKFLSEQDALMKKWREDDETARAYIEKYVDKSYIKDLLDKESAYEMWKMLEKKGRKHQGTQSFFTYQSFLNLKYNHKIALGDYVNQHQELVDKLETTKCAVSPYCAAMKLLISLPDEYNQLVQSLIQEEELSLSFIKESLMREDNRMKTVKLIKKEDETFIKEEEANQTKAEKMCKKCKKRKLSPNAPPNAVICAACYRAERMKKAEANYTSNKEKEKKTHKSKSNKEKAKKDETSESDSDAKSCLVEVSTENEKKEIIASNLERKRREEKRNTWYLDSGCTAHLTNQKELIENAKKTEIKISGPLQNAKSSQASIVGEINLKIKNEREEINNFELKKVICDKNLRRNLMSVRKLTKEGHSVIFCEDKCYIINSKPIYEKESVIMMGKIDDTGLYAIAENLNGIYKNDNNNCYTNNNNKSNNNNNNILSNLMSTSMLFSKPLTLKELHVRLGHVPYLKILEMEKLNQLSEYQVKRVKDDMKDECEICARAKLPRTVFATQKLNPAANVGDAIHTDLCGPLPPSLGKNIYFVTYIDEKSDYTYISFIKKKSDNFEILKKMREKIKTQSGKRMKRLVSDGGGEYIGAEVKEYLEKKGIIQQLTPPDTPQMNGKSERLNRTLMNFVRAMLIERNLPQEFWGECARYAVYIRNRMSKRGEKKSRFEIFYKRKPAPLRVQVFGSMVYYKNNSKKKKKLDEKARLGVFVGVNEEEGTYRIYDPERKSVVRSRDVMFFENSRIPVSMLEGEKEILYLKEEEIERAEVEKRKETQDESESEESDEEIVPQPRAQPLAQPQMEPRPRARRGERRLQEVREDNLNNNQIPTLGNSRYPNRRANINNNANNNVNNNINNNANNINNNINNNANNNVNNFNNNGDQEESSSEEEITDIFSYAAEMSNTRNSRKDPRSYQEAMKRDDKKEWQEAMGSEKKSMKEMNTFEEVKNVPDGCNIIDSKWVFTTKYDENGEEVRKKARLVGRGDKQKEGIDFNETFAPVLKYQTLRYIISYALENNLFLGQLDVETAFLNGLLREVIYMRLPIGYDENVRKIVKLIKSIYGLKQSPRCWNERFVKELLEMKYIQSLADPCLFIREEKNGERSFISVFVDDLIIAAKDKKEVDEIKKKLMEKFKMRDLGELSWILGMKVERDKEKIQISQETYINQILDRFSMNESKPAPTPLPQKIEELTKTKEAKEEFYDVKKYQKIVGALLYLSNTTRPDITFAVNYLARSMSKPSNLSYQLSKRVLRYLNGTRKLKLTYAKKEDIKGYSDASYAEDREDRKSTGGYTFMMNGGAVSWRSTKQKVVTLSSCEAEYYALAEAAKEAMWLYLLMKSVQNEKNEKPMIIFEDNQSTIKIAKNPIHSDRTKHIDVRHHFIREKVAEKKIEVKYIPTVDQIADIFTKSLRRVQHQKFTRELGLVY